MYSSCTPLWLISPPALIDTSTTRSPSPRAGTTQLACDADTTVALLDVHDSPLTPQYTPPSGAARNPDPVNTISVPPSTDTITGATELTFIALTNCIVAKPLVSCPLTNTDTVVLPSAPAGDIHFTTPPITDMAPTRTVLPNSQSTNDAPSSNPLAAIITMLPPSVLNTDGVADCMVTADVNRNCMEVLVEVPMESTT
jgi:hypothetical protein